MGYGGRSGDLGGDGLFLSDPFQDSRTEAFASDSKSKDLESDPVSWRITVLQPDCHYGSADPDE